MKLVIIFLITFLFSFLVMAADSSDCTGTTNCSGGNSLDKIVKSSDNNAKIGGRCDLNVALTANSDPGSFPTNGNSNGSSSSGKTGN